MDFTRRKKGGSKKYVDMGGTNLPEYFYKPVLFFIFMFCFLYFVMGGKYEEIVRKNRLETLRKAQKESISHRELGIKPILILIVVTNDTDIDDYRIAINTIQCYAKIQQYSFMIVIDSDFNCPQKDKFFRRHCVVSEILPKYEYILFVDADIGVVNPKKEIEEYLFDDFDITFYDRFYNWEVAMGSYIVKNSAFSVQFLKDFSNYENQLPNTFHGSDNGAIHLFLAKTLFPNCQRRINLCQNIYRTSNSFEDLFIFEACIRTIFGEETDFQNIRIMHKGTGWVRDGWLTDGTWNPNTDFMIHGWKSKQLQPYDDSRENRIDTNKWFNPLAGSIDLERCHPKNTTWSYVRQLIENKNIIGDKLRKYEEKVKIEQRISTSKIYKF